MVTGGLVSRVQGTSVSDPTGLGRWTGITLCGSDQQQLTITTAYYRVCSDSIGNAPLGSSFAREYNYFHHQLAKEVVNPRRLFLRDLQSQILHFQESGHAVILMLDANATFESDPHFEAFIDTCSLFDLHVDDPAASTFTGAESRRIDYIFGYHHACQYLERSGTLAYNEGPQSDHRGLYADIRLNFFSHSASPIAPSSSRTIHTRNPELVERYNAKVLDYYTEH